jgi:ferrous iron transport protein B
MTTSPVEKPAATRQKTLALVGHPNVGKSVIFHALTGKYVTVSNFPGTTVDISRGTGTIRNQSWHVFDSPGVFGLQPRTEDERVSRDLLIEARPDIVIQVADAKHLSKALHLTLEISEYGIPMVLALNMSDEALDRGIAIDTKRLEEILGIPVIETVAITGDGITDLKNALDRAAVPIISPLYEGQLRKTLETIESHFLPETLEKRALAVSLFAKDKSIWGQAVQHVKSDSLGKLEADVKIAQEKYVRPPEALLFEARQHLIQEISGEVLTIQTPGGRTWLSHLGNWCMRPFPGYLIAAFALFLLYEFVGVFGAGTLVGLLEDNLFGNLINPFFTSLIKAIIPWTFIQEAFVGPYGVITMALTYAFALILPIVTTFFLFFGILEDSGYLPRLAVMMDRFFRLMGLNGRAILPMILGLGCDTMATVTTRILDTTREKIILSLLLTLAVPCSAQLGAILGMASGFSPKVLLIWFVVISGTMLLVGWSAAKLMPGARSPLLIELPPLRIPKLSNLAKKIRARLKWYMKEVIPLFVMATLALFILDKLTLLAWLERMFSPLVVSWLGLPAESAQAFLIGFFRRDYGAAGFFHLAQDGLLSTRQVAVAMVVVTLFMPCVAHFLVTLKERGTKVTAAITIFVFSFALGIGGLLNFILQRI